MSLCTSFAPVIAPTAKIIILGSMPGIKSLTAAEYYAHPHNRFWPLMTTLCGRSTVPPVYRDRLTMLTDSGFALWDVLKLCQRDGSLDSAITSEEPNDLPTLLHQYPNIELVAFNGAKAAASYKKHFRAFMQSAAVTYVQLPSTSPANARWRLPELTQCWHDALTAQHQPALPPSGSAAAAEKTPS